MIEAASSIPFDEYWIGSNSPDKVGVNSLIIKALAATQGKEVSVHSVNPENWDKESEDIDATVVAEKKDETVITHAELSGEKTAVLAFDVVALYNGEEDLKRLLRQIPQSDPNLPAKKQWDHIDAVLRKERRKMKERFTQGAFFIEWQVAFALLSADKSVRRNALLVIKKVFEPLSRKDINVVFRLSKKLKEMRENGIVPDHKELAEGVLAFLVGPGLRFAEIPGAEEQQIIVRNRDYPEIQQPLNPDALLRLVRDCALPPHAMAAFLAGEDMDPSIEKKDSFYVELSGINDYGTILASEYAHV